MKAKQHFCKAAQVVFSHMQREIWLEPNTLKRTWGEHEHSALSVLKLILPAQAVWFAGRQQSQFAIDLYNIDVMNHMVDWR